MDPGDCPGFSPRRNSRLVQIRSCGQYAASSPRLPANVRHMVVIYDVAAEVWAGNRVRPAAVTAFYGSDRHRFSPARGANSAPHAPQLGPDIDRCSNGRGLAVRTGPGSRPGAAHEMSQGG